MSQQPVVDGASDARTLEPPTGVMALRIGCLVLALLISSIVVFAVWPRDGRAPVEIIDVTSVSADQLELTVGVGSCYGEPRVSVLESSDFVTLSATAVGPNAEERLCSDSATVSLVRPLGDRAVADGYSGETLDLKVAFSQR